ncbi:MULTISPECIES: TetR/AcrR family transcriptional regulator [unclassified Streptomyces]|uniref:TetR/AcrR family transcriptional regulator n=1 Tax=unclassified Streptomyces TaxID=2593676 RepID=UPI000CD56363|nr:TetR/AcrR family transcriptional regulator [Streptomyces sp. SM10]
MPSAREALLDSAHSSLSALPWTAVRMVDVAAAAGVSRQTLYNEFGSKGGLARALIRRAADGYLAGVEETLGRAGDEGPAALARWTVRSARADVLVKALLTGVRGDRLPGPGALPPAGRDAWASLPTPGELLVLVRDRAVAALRRGPAPCEAAKLGRECEIALRLAISYMLVPADDEAHCAEPDSCRPITPMITSEIDTSLRAETTSSRKTIP